MRPHDEARETAAPNKNLFVVNYDPEATSLEDLEAYFSKWGNVEKIQMKDKYSFIEVCIHEYYEPNGHTCDQQKVSSQLKFSSHVFVEP